jgi:hypothetical protein
MLAGGSEWASMAKRLGAVEAGAPDVNTFEPVSMAKALGDQDITVTAKDGGKQATVEMDLNMANLIAAMGAAGDRLGLGDRHRCPSPSRSPRPWTAEGLPLKVATVTEDGYGKTQTMTMTYSEWGEPVSIAAPPAAEVTTMCRAPATADSSGAAPSVGLHGRCGPPWACSPAADLVGPRRAARSRVPLDQ